MYRFKNNPLCSLTLGLGVIVSVACASTAEVPKVEIRCLPVAVAGLPMPVEIEVHGKIQIAIPDILNDVSPYQFYLKSEEIRYTLARRISREIPHPYRTLHELGPEATMTIPVMGTRIPHGTSSRYLLDLAHLETWPWPVEGARRKQNITADQIVPDTYTIRIEYDYVDKQADLRPRPAIKLVAPNAEEARLIKRVYALESDKPPWWTFIERSAEVLRGIHIDRFSEAGRRQLQYHLLFARLVHSKADIANLVIEPQELENLWPGYETDVFLLVYEIEMAAGKEADAETTRQIILATRPTAKYLLENVRAHGGLIARFRDRLAEEASKDTDSP